MDLWLPTSFTDKEPRFYCRVCKAKFSEMSGYTRHVSRHARYDEDVIRNQSLRVKAPELLGDEGGVDLEFEDWHSKRGLA